MRLPLVAPWGKAARGFGVTLAVVSITAVVGLWTHGCEDTKRFQCGVPLDGDSSVTRACDGPNEVCICWTHACARRQSPDHVKGEANYCESGFRYLDAPFGPPKAPKPIDVTGGETTSSTTETGSTTSTASSMESTTSTTTIEPIPIDEDLGECVPVALVEWSVIGTQLCKDSEHAPDTYPDAGAEDASAGGVGGSGTTSSGGGGTTSSGGGETGGTTTGGSGGVTTSSSGGTGGMTTSGGGTGGATGGTGGAT